MIKMVKVGVLGATGMVGQRFIQLLADHPDFEIAAITKSSFVTYPIPDTLVSFLPYLVTE